MNRGIFRSQVALDMDIALWAMRKNHAEQIILLAVRLQSWNAAVSHKISAKDPWPDPLPAVLNLSQLAVDYGCSRRHLSEAKASLTEDKVLIPLGDGVTINKDVDGWASGRLSPQAREQSRDAAHVKHPTNRRPQGEPKWAQPGEPESAQEVSPNGRTPEKGEPGGEPTPEPKWAHTSAHPSAQGGDDAGRSKTHAGARPCEEDSSSLPELKSKNSLSSSPSPEPTLVGGGDGAGGVERESKIPTQDRKARLTAWVQENFGNGFLRARQLNGLICGDEPEDWVKRAIQLAAVEARMDESVAPFARGHLARFKANGRMDDGPAPAAKGEPETVKLTERQQYFARAKAALDAKKAARLMEQANVTGT